MPVVQPPLGLPISGVDGKVYINSYYYPAAYWQWDMTSGAIELPSTSSSIWVDNQKNHRHLLFRAGGTARKDFNPFNLNGFSPFLNSYANVRVTAQGQQVASCEYTLITAWNWKDEADGVVFWELEGVGSFKFANLNDTTL